MTHEYKTLTQQDLREAELFAPALVRQYEQLIKDIKSSVESVLVPAKQLLIERGDVVEAEYGEGNV